MFNQQHCKIMTFLITRAVMISNRTCLSHSVESKVISCWSVFVFVRDKQDTVWFMTVISLQDRSRFISVTLCEEEEEVMSPLRSITLSELAAGFRFLLQKLELCVDTDVSVLLLVWYLFIYWCCALRNINLFIYKTSGCTRTLNKIQSETGAKMI